jgi:hypothetical protein
MVLKGILKRGADVQVRRGDDVIWTGMRSEGRVEGRGREERGERREERGERREERGERRE